MSDSADNGEQNVLHVQLLCEDDALEIIQPLELYPPRLSKWTTTNSRRPVVGVAATPEPGVDARRSLRHSLRRRRRDSGVAPVSDDDDGGDVAASVGGADASPTGPSFIDRELASAQLEADASTADGDSLAGRAVFSFQRTARARCKRHTAGPSGSDATVHAPAASTAVDQPSPASVTGKRRLPTCDENSVCTTPKRRRISSAAQLPSGGRSTPRRVARGSPLTPVVSTPVSVRRVGATFASPVRPKTTIAATGAASTPYALRRRIKLRLSKLSQDDLAVSDDDADDSDVSDFEPSEHEEEDDDDEVVDNDDSKSAASGSDGERTQSPPLPSSVRRAVVGDATQDDVVASLDDYFMQHAAVGGGGCVTSDRTLSRLQQPRLSEAAVRQLCTPDSGGELRRHATGRQALLRRCDALFDRWLLLLTCGYSVVLYGLGSKRQVLERFRVRRLAEQLHVVVNGFFPDLSARQLLHCLLTDILGVAPARQSGSVQAQTELVFRHFDEPTGGGAAPRLFLLVASMDGPALRGGSVQQLLCRLAAARRVHVLGTVDHINAPLVWQHHQLAALNMIWFDATTMCGYVEETSYENSLLVRSGGRLALSSLRHVFQSLTQNARGVFLILAREQVDHADDRSYAGMSEASLYRRCRDSFLVSSQLALTAQLTEFRDHKLLNSRAAADGSQLLTVPLESGLIVDFLGWCDQL